jgi:glycosyltransferase involved in cell wall biosynthesis
VRPPGAAQRVNQMPSPIVSVILPTRDRAHCVADAIASVQAQHFTDWELIIVDDGSLDDTASVVEPFLDDRRIHYVEQAASGSCAARNHGQRLARGGLIAYLDSDNVWYPGFLSAAADTLAIRANGGPGLRRARDRRASARRDARKLYAVRPGRLLEPTSST